MSLNPLLDADLAHQAESLFQGKTDSFELNDLIEFPAAVVTDIGVSLINSFLPKNDEIQTEDVLSKISTDLSDFYLNHRTGVNVTSFIGGLILPGVLVGKALKLAKAGKIGLAGRPFQFFDNKIGQNRDAALQLLKDGGDSTLQLIQAKRRWRGAVIGQAALESATFEGAVALMLNGHPFLENYNESDFLIGTALGTAFVPIKLIWEGNRFRKLAQEIESKDIAGPAVPLATQTIIPTLKGARNLGEEIGRRAFRISEQENLLASDINATTREIVDTELVKTKRKQADAVVSMMTPRLKDTLRKAANLTGDKLNLVGEAKDPFLTDSLGHILSAVNSRFQSFMGVDRFDLFTTKSAVSKEAAKDLGIKHVFVDAKDSGGVGIESFEGGTIADVQSFLRLGKLEPFASETNAAKAISESSGRDITELFNGDKIRVGNTDVQLQRQENHFTLTLFDSDKEIAERSQLRKFVQDTVRIINNPNATMDVKIVQTEIPVAGQGELSKFFDKAQKLSEREAKFLVDDTVGNASMTPGQFTGEQLTNPRQFYISGEGLATGQRLIGPVTGARTFTDVTPEGGKVALIEIPKNTRIATPEDLRALREVAADQGINFFKGNRVLPLDKLITPETTRFLAKQGFAGVDVNLTNPARRTFSTLGVHLFGKGAIVRQGEVAQSQLIKARGLPVFPNEHEIAVYSPFHGRVLPASQAKLVLGAADIEGGYVRNFKYTIGKIVSGLTDFAPFRDATHITEAQYLDAIAALPQGKFIPKVIDVAIDDLPRLNAISTRPDLVDKVRLIGPGGKAISTAGDLSSEQLTAVLNSAKVEWARALHERGYAIEQIVRYTNTPQNTVEKFLAADFNPELLRDFADKTAQFQIFASSEAGSIARYLRPKMLKLSGDKLNSQDLIRNRQIQEYDRKLLDNAADAVIEEVTSIAASEVPLVGALMDIVRDSRFATLIENGREFFTSFGLGKSTITSRDFTLRNLPTVDGRKLGDLVTGVGDNIGNAINKAISNKEGTGIVDRANRAFRPIADDPVATVFFGQIFKSLNKVGDKQARQMLYIPDSETTGKIAIAFETTEGGSAVPTEFLRYVKANGEFSDEVIHVNIDSVHNLLLNAWPNVQQDMLALINVNRALIGKPDIVPRGIWFPYNDLRNSHKAYLFDGINPDNTRVVIGKTPAELDAKLFELKKELDPSIQVVKQSNVEDFNRLSAYEATNEFKRADATLKKSGVLVENVSATPELLDEILRSLEGDIWKHGRTLVRHAGYKLFDQLDAITTQRQASARSALGTFAQKAATKADMGTVVAKTVLGLNLLDNNQLLNTANNQFSFMIDRSANIVADAMQAAGIGKAASNVSLATYEQLIKDLSAKGIPNPYSGWEQFAAANSKIIQGAAPGFVARANSALVTLTLRAWELSHAAVTTMSLPIVLGAELTSQGGFTYPLKYMMKGTKSLFSSLPEHVTRRATAARKGYTSLMTAELTESMEKLVSGSTILDKVADNKAARTAFRILTAASDTSEIITRELAYSSFYELAIDTLGKGRDLVEYENFANTFTKRAMGNYVARQRPVLFQGTLGATFGLFQTFMLSMAQQMFRFVEQKDLAAITALIGSQIGIFGTNTLPLYDTLNTAIGAYSGEKHGDLNTLTFKLFGNNEDQSRTAAEAILFGLPSSLFQTAFYTRGELEPRLPFSAGRGGLSVLPPVVSAAVQLFQTAKDTATNIIEIAANAGTPIDISRAVGEGLSLQTVSRPIARIAELITGTSRDRTGRIIDANTSFQMNVATVSRVFASRPLKEQVLRSLNYSNDYYTAIDNQNRKDVIRAMRSLVTGNPDNETFGSLFQRYMDAGGSLKGFQQAMNESMLSLSNGPAQSLADERNRHTEIDKIFQGYLN